MPTPREEPEGSSGGGEKRKGKSRPTTSRRNKRQKTKAKYAKAREEAQLEGIIPTTPEGAVRDERSHSVDPLEGLPAMVRQALKEKWATPDQAKPAILAALLRPFFNEVPLVTSDGELVHVPASPKLLNELARTILALDQTQWERDNPAQAGQARGTINGVPTSGVVAVSVSVDSNKLAVKVLREHFEAAMGADIPALEVKEDSPEEPPRFDGNVEIGAVGQDGEEFRQ